MMAVEHTMVMVHILVLMDFLRQLLIHNTVYGRDQLVQLVGFGMNIKGHVLAINIFQPDFFRL